MAGCTWAPRHTWFLFQFQRVQAIPFVISFHGTHVVNTQTSPSHYNLGPRLMGSGSPHLPSPTYIRKKKKFECRSGVWSSRHQNSCVGAASLQIKWEVEDCLDRASACLVHMFTLASWFRQNDMVGQEGKFVAKINMCVIPHTHLHCFDRSMSVSRSLTSR